MDLKPAIICLGPSGLETARRAATELVGELFVRGESDEGTPFSEPLPLLRELFLAGRPVIGVCAAGILIRALAPVIADKRTEPPVLAVAEDGASVVPLLGGHHGGNRLARELAEALNGHAALTTAGEARFKLALDEPPTGWRLADAANVKTAMAKLLAGGGVTLTGDGADQADWLQALPEGDDIRIHIGLSPGDEQSVLTNTEAPSSAPRSSRASGAEPGPAKGDQRSRLGGRDTAGSDLTYHPVRAALGVGCSRNCPPEELAKLVRDTLAELNLSPLSLAGVFSIDLKADEVAVIELAKQLALPLRFFTAEELARETPRLANPSEVVFREVGCHGVAEGAALVAAGEDAKLWAPKRKTRNATCAVALAAEPISQPKGQKRGSVMLVSIGPGQALWRSPEASAMIARADELVGYKLYLDLLGPGASAKPRAPYELGDEQARCRYALERAGEGRDVALVCSGDAGIYAMGALVYELLDRSPCEGGVSQRAHRAEVIATPGISAFQAASARMGALLGHDFCAISLSDLLTPRAQILKRLQAAADGDFVVALYNPVSKRRRELLDIARDTLLKARPAETPVLLASNLGRAGEALRLRTLETLATDEVDMLTVVLIGSSASRLVETPDGPRLYTPRGYRKRIEEDLG